MRKRTPANPRGRGVVKTAWDLTQFYRSEKDPRIERDVRGAERAAAAFAKKFKGADFSNRRVLHTALTAYEALAAMPEFDRPLRYFSFRRELDATDSVAEKMLNRLSDRLTKAGNQLIFFELALGALPQKTQKDILRDNTLREFRYYLARLFENARYHLTEPEEKILNLEALPASHLWTAGMDKIMNQKTVRFSGKDVPLMEALTLVSRLEKKPRRLLWQKSVEVLKSIADVAENELNAVVINKKINDELRGYTSPHSATVLGNENRDESVEALVRAVTERFNLSHRFYALKARLFKEKKLLYPDKAAPYGKEVRIPFSSAVETLREVFYGLHHEYGTILDRMLARGQIDVYPKKGKSGGAFCASTVNQATYVLLNQVDDMHSLTTFAHEMGHAIHAERAKSQRPLYQGHSTAAAETASTLFENLVFESMLEKLSEKERLVALHGKLNDEVSTIMRQIAFFNFETELHETVRKEGSMTKEELARTLQKHLAAYLGPKVDVTLDDGYSFVYISHFRMFFYVYTYAYGNLVSNALAARWKEDPSYIASIDRFLSAGASASPEDIFGAIGVTTEDPSFFMRGLDGFATKLEHLERLAKKLGAA